MADETSHIQVATTKHFAISAVIAAMIAVIICGGLHLLALKALRCPQGVYRNTRPPPACWYDYVDASGNPQHVALNTCPSGC
jgi:hypothetical protein